MHATIMHGRGDMHGISYSVYVIALHRAPGRPRRSQRLLDKIASCKSSSYSYR